MKHLLLLLGLFIGFSTSSLYAQLENLPKGYAPFEREMMEDYLSTRSLTSSGIITPPTSPVRTMAEWEEIQSLVITWTGFQDILKEIVRHAKEECEVIIVCDNPTQVSVYLTNHGIDDSNNVTYLQTDYNSIWIRDYGQNTVYTNDVDSLILVDWIYNRPRPDDDIIPEEIAILKNLPIYSTTAPPYDIVHTGGNFMSDGMGTAFSSRLLIEENGPNGDFNPSNHTEGEIDTILNLFMGIDRYIKMDELPYDVIHHIDMHMKLLDEETLLMGEYPQGVADGPQIEANLQYVLDNFDSSFGTEYEVVRITMPPDANDDYPDYPGNQWWLAGDYRTYTNCLFINKTVLVPIYEEFYDSTALRVLEEQLPGYNVVGIDCNDIIPYSGALHCITRELGVADPLRIVHQRLRDTPSTNDYEVNAIIQHQSSIQQASIHYRVDGGAYQSVPMTLTNATDATWTGFIPGQATNTNIQYYIEAQAMSGKQQVRPMPAPDGYWEFDVDGVVDVEPVIALPTQLEAIYPNPAGAITCVPVKSEGTVQASIQLYDVLGRVVHTIFEGELSHGEHNYFFNADRYPSGTYFVRLTTDTGAQVQKVIIR